MTSMTVPYPVPYTKTETHEYNHTTIPQRYAWFCFSTCHVYLVIAVLFLLCKQPILKIVGGLLLGLFLTSIMYWKDPILYSFADRLDKVMVYAAILFSTYAMYRTSSLVFTIWMFVLSLCAIVHITNEVLYYYQVAKPNDIRKSNPTYERRPSTTSTTTPKKEHCIFDRYFSIEPTWPQTEERDFAYYRYTITHGLGVHLLTGGIAGISVAVICLLKYQQ